MTNQNTIQARLVSAQEAAQFLGINRMTVYEHMRRGTIPSVRIGKRWLVPVSYLEQMEAATAPARLPPRKAPEQRRTLTMAEQVKELQRLLVELRAEVAKLQPVEQLRTAVGLKAQLPNA